MTEDKTDCFFTLHEAEEIDSTQEWIKRLYREGAPEGTVVSAKTQTAGRGRGQRRWNSPMGESLSFSVLLKPQIPTNDAPMLSVIMGLAVQRAIDDICGTHAMIKWPNDVILSDKKVCGILTELIPQPESAGAASCIIGVGINNSITVFPPELQDKATSILMVTGKPADPKLLIYRILDGFLVLYRNFVRKPDLSDLVDDYNRVLVNRGRQVRLIDHGKSYTATAGGIDETGALNIIKENGESESVRSGEVSVRGLYGYV